MTEAEQVADGDNVLRTYLDLLRVKRIARLAGVTSYLFKFSPLGLIRRAHLLITYVMPIQPYAASVCVAVLILSKRKPT